VHLATYTKGLGLEDLEGYERGCSSSCPLRKCISSHASHHDVLQI
jgi:hypothetical protein